MSNQPREQISATWRYVQIKEIFQISRFYCIPFKSYNRLKISHIFY